ncbi:MAG: hypothetical protein ABII72_00530, partial [Parcubacteria group bacterium]
VTFFNGSIVNNSVDANGNSTIAVTLADDVRIDGEIYRTEKGGDNAIKISDNVIPTETATNDFGASANRWNSVYAKDGNFSGTLTAGTVAASALSGSGIVSSTNIADGAVAATDLASNSVTSAKIADGTIVSGDLDDDSVTPAKINGTGGANLPIAYGYVDATGNLVTGTTNVSAVPSGTVSIITIDGINYAPDEYVVVVTPNGSTHASVRTIESGNSIVVSTYDIAGATASLQAFHFVVFPI